MTNLKTLTCAASGIALAAALAPGAVLAQQAPAEQAPAPQGRVLEETVIVTGSSIRRRVENSPSPIQIVTPEELRRDSISSPEQFVASLSANVAGMDNLAANADVTPAENRSNRGASFANLRGQGPAGTLVLLNGRRVAAHGMSGGAVDLNQFPLAAMTRIEVLKDGASAVYGTDAVGGVINFITRDDYQGLTINAFGDATQEGGGNIYSGSILAGYGDIDTQGFNIMGVVSMRQNEELLASDRDFVDGYQEDRGLSIDTRGTPFGTIFPLNQTSGSFGPFMPAGGTLLGTTNGTGAALSPFMPGSTTKRAVNGVNPLALPGGLGCGAIQDMADYFEQLWIPASTSAVGGPETAALACSWDTGEQVSIQQEQESMNYLVRGTLRLGEHEIAAEYMGSQATANNRFSHIQLIPNSAAITGPASTSSNFAYFRVPGVNEAVYDRVANALVAAFPTDTALAARRAQNLPIAMRWRCLECGRRELETETTTRRIFLGADGPLGIGDWTYRTGVSQAVSEAETTLGSGYYFRNAFTVNGVQRNNGLVQVFNSGILNPFLLPGQTQSPAALAALETASARGVVLFGGQFTVTQFDGSASGTLFTLPAGPVMAAIGFDFRTEEYEFNGDQRTALERPDILGAPFDQANVLSGVSRDVKALYAELLIPVFTDFELTLAVRTDEYDGFGRTTNPKVAFRYKVNDLLMFRGSYNTGFRVPSFNQIYNGVTDSGLSLGQPLVDPFSCPSLISSAEPGCANILLQGTPPVDRTGGNLELGPEESEQVGFGVVMNFARNMSIQLDWWRIERTGTIGTLSLANLYANAQFFPERFVRNAAGQIVVIDRRIANIGGNKAEGLDISVRNNGEIWGGRWSAALDGTYAIDRREQLLPSLPYGPDQVGQFTLFRDLTLGWRHSASVNFTRGDWSFSLSQLFRSSYLDNFTYPGLVSGAVQAPNLKRRVPAYILYNTSVTYRGIDGLRVTAGVRNLFNTDPPFTLNYDSGGGSGSSWEPRVADPRGRSFTISVEYEF